MGWPTDAQTDALPIWDFPTAKILAPLGMAEKLVPLLNALSQILPNSRSLGKQRSD